MCFFFVEYSPIENARKSTRIQQKPMNYSDDTKHTAGSKQENEVEIPKDLPISILTDKPTAKVGKIMYFDLTNLKYLYIYWIH